MFIVVVSFRYRLNPENFGYTLLYMKGVTELHIFITPALNGIELSALDSGHIYPGE
jgi:hypothetical protein